jgi:hypothetical protein
MSNVHPNVHPNVRANVHPNVRAPLDLDLKKNKPEATRLGRGRRQAVRG